MTRMYIKKGNLIYTKKNRMRMRRFGVSWWTLLFTSKWAVALEQRDDFVTPFHLFGRIRGTKGRLL